MRARDPAHPSSEQESVCRRPEGGSVLATLLLSFGLALSVPAAARAEPYVAVFGGTAFTESTALETSLAIDGASLLEGELREIDFRDSPLIGGKVGYFLTRPLLGGHVGTELEFYYTRPWASRQTVTFSGRSSGAPATFETSVQSSNVEIYTVAVNALYRVPILASADLPNGRVQPYVGAGAGAFIATMRTRTSPFDQNKRIHDTDAQPGVQAVGGLKVFLLRNLALFAEYRFVQTGEFNFRFEERGTVGGVPATETARDRADLTQHQMAFGISLHW